MRNAESAIAIDRYHLLAVAVLAAASGCGDGVGQPIRADGSNTDTLAFAGATAATNASFNPKSSGGIAGAALVAGPSGGSSAATTTKPDAALLDCSMTQQWPAEWTVAEEDLLYYLNTFREAAFPCLASTSTVPAPELSMAATLRCAARLHSVSGFSAGGAASRIVNAGFPANRVEEVIALSDVTDLSLTQALATMLLGDDDRDCTNLMDPQFTSVGIGFAADSDFGYWTVDLASE